MKNLSRYLAGAIVASGFACLCLVQATTPATKPEAQSSVADTTKLKPQTTCPIMGSAIDKKLYVDYNGKRIYVCCAGCVDAIKKDPEAAIKKLRSIGQDVETIATSQSAVGCPMAAKGSTKGVMGKNEKGEATCTFYTCSMHPEVMQAQAGKCPTCEMDLVKKTQLAAQCKMPCKADSGKAAEGKKK